MKPSTLSLVIVVFKVCFSYDNVHIGISFEAFIQLMSYGPFSFKENAFVYFQA